MITRLNFNIELIKSLTKINREIYKININNFM